MPYERADALAILSAVRRIKEIAGFPLHQPRYAACLTDVQSHPGAKESSDETECAFDLVHARERTNHNRPPGVQHVRDRLESPLRDHGVEIDALGEEVCDLASRRDAWSIDEPEALRKRERNKVQCGTRNRSSCDAPYHPLVVYRALV